MTAGIPASSKTVLQICHLNEIVSWPEKKAGTFMLSCKYRLRDGWMDKKGGGERGFGGKSMIEVLETSPFFRGAGSNKAAPKKWIRVEKSDTNVAASLV